MVIPCLCLFTALRTLAAEPPVNKKRTRTLFRKESGSSTNCMVGELLGEPHQRREEQQHRRSAGAEGPELGQLQLCGGEFL